MKPVTNAEWAELLNKLGALPDDMQRQVHDTLTRQLAGEDLKIEKRFDVNNRRVDRGFVPPPADAEAAGGSTGFKLPKGD